MTPFSTTAALARLAGAALALGGLASTAMAQAPSGYTPYDLYTLGGPTSGAMALNNIGQFAGVSTLEDAHQHGIITTLATFQAVGVDPLAPDLESHVFSLNDAGQAAVQSYSLGSLDSRGLLWAGGASTDLGIIAPRGLNNSGLVVGYLTRQIAGYGAIDKPAKWQAGAITELATLGGQYGYAAACNDLGWIVGWSQTLTNRNMRPTLWRNGSAPVDLGTLGGTAAQAHAVNAAGLVAGYSDLTGTPVFQHACLWTLSAAGAVVSRKDLGALPGSTSYANGINARGDVVGTSAGHAVLWPNASAPESAIVDLNDLLPANSGWVLERAWAINDWGYIAGTGIYFGMPHGFVLVPATCTGDIVSIGGLPPPDGLLTGDDFIAFIDAFAAGDLLADIVSIGGAPPPDGLVTGDDFNAFINAFASGCP